MTAEEFRPIWLKKIGYKDMIELELARISADNMEDIPDEDEFAEAYAKQENKKIAADAEKKVEELKELLKEAVDLLWEIDGSIKGDFNTDYADAVRYKLEQELKG